ncbi:MAG: LacI family DNA-binding transcriptional regulator [Gammaproteobacteria bacterium]|nr:LacI family DNA-binding transcriptional regulator [Gammaproteobacteria bacterium]
MKLDNWHDVAARLDDLDISRAELARRCGLSESTVVKGLRDNRKLQGATRRAVEAVLHKLMGAAA